MNLEDRCVMVTGAAGNLGRAVAQTFAARGAALVLVDAQALRLQQAFGSESERRMFAPADLLDQASVDALVAAAVARFGRIDALCNLAGGFRMGTAAHETPDRDWEAMFDVNVRTLLRATRAVVPRMIEAGRGSIVNVGAFAAQRGASLMGAYVAAKSAVIRITETLSAELRDKGINVNCVLPTIIDTPENRAAMPDADPRRWVAPEDLAQAIAFLASAEARAIHGVALPVTGLG